jgi:hypothetical protein
MRLKKSRKRYLEKGKNAKKEIIIFSQLSEKNYIF